VRGLRPLARSKAERCAPSGVRVNTVHPGYVPPMLTATNIGPRADKLGRTPLRRIGKPIEVAYGVLFLASDEAPFVNGAANSSWRAVLAMVLPNSGDML
jgi:NAD(P)-dependent dehydrogenase (short-subunit alcohol dehydrogenase family)